MEADKRRVARMTCNCGATISWSAPDLLLVLAVPVGWSRDSERGIQCPACRRQAEQKEKTSNAE